MWSKIARFNPLLRRSGLLLTKIVLPTPQLVRCSAILPKSQYDTLGSGKLRLFNMMTVNWEVIPLVLSTLFAVALTVFSIGWALQNKMDVSFSHDGRKVLSRTMDLRNPTVHKFITINQMYYPWPEMQDVQDKMTAAEKQLRARKDVC